MSLIDQVLNDPAASFWLKDAVRVCVKRDALNALRDAELLVKILQERNRALAGLR